MPTTAQILVRSFLVGASVGFSISLILLLLFWLIGGLYL